MRKYSYNRCLMSPFVFTLMMATTSEVTSSNTERSIDGTIVTMIDGHSVSSSSPLEYKRHLDGVDIVTSMNHLIPLDFLRSSGRRTYRQSEKAEDVVVFNDNIDSTNGTFIISNGNSAETGISDKDIVLIVVCCSVLLVICLVGVALLAKCHCGKIRGDQSAHYHGVLQRDSLANSPIDEQSTIATSNKDNDAHGHTNMFAQIDEIDEAESCPSSPVGNHLKRISNARRPSPGMDGFETKPLLTYTEATPTSCVKEFDADDGSIGEASLVDNEDPMNSSVADIRVEIVTSPNSYPSNFEIPTRMYCRTGLSQSDYSISSFTSVNPSYHYGNQVGYLSGHYGYPSEKAYSYFDEDQMMGFINPDYYVDDGACTLLLSPRSIGTSNFGIFPSQESDLDVSVRAVKDSGSDEVTIDGASIIGDVERSDDVLDGNDVDDRNQTMTINDSGSDLSMDRSLVAGYDGQNNDKDDVKTLELPEARSESMLPSIQVRTSQSVFEEQIADDDVHVPI